MNIHSDILGELLKQAEDYESSARAESEKWVSKAKAYEEMAMRVRQQIAKTEGKGEKK